MLTMHLLPVVSSGVFHACPMSISLHCTASVSHHSFVYTRTVLCVCAADPTPSQPAGLRLHECRCRQRQRAQGNVTTSISLGAPLRAFRFLNTILTLTIEHRKHPRRRPRGSSSTPSSAMASSACTLAWEAASLASRSQTGTSFTLSACVKTTSRAD